MKYLPLAGLDAVSSALNFSTPDSHIIGGCDLYTTKAAGRDKKLYRSIEEGLEREYESLVSLSASLSPPTYHDGEIEITGVSDIDGEGAEKVIGPDGRRGGGGDIEALLTGKDSGKPYHKLGRSKMRSHTPDIDLSRSSPFGPLSQITARRTFAYLIATLNASHPDYDFSHLLNPSDFRREPSLRRIMAKIDSTLQNLRPHPRTTYLAPPAMSMMSNSLPVANGLGNEIWSPRMWNLIDKEMSLRYCDKYSYVPDDDPFDCGDEGPAIWSMHYFFFNKERKRVCYLYLRGLSVISHSPVHAPTYLRSKSAGGVQRKRSAVSVGEGAGKRASYWLGDKFSDDEIDTSHYAEEYDDDDEAMLNDPEDDEMEVPRIDLDDIRSDLADGHYSYDAEDFDLEVIPNGWSGGYTSDFGLGALGAGAVAANVPRGVSEEVGERMEL